MTVPSRPQEPGQLAVPASDLAALAAAILVPADRPWSARAHAYLAEARVGDAWRWVVVFGLDGGRRDSAPVGPAFVDAADAAALARRLNAGPDHPTATIEPPADEDAGVTAVSDLVIHMAAGAVTPSAGPSRAPATRCVACGAQLPESRQARRTCSGRCRVAAWRVRHRTGAGRDPDPSPAIHSHANREGQNDADR